MSPLLCGLPLLGLDGPPLHDPAPPPPGATAEKAVRDAFGDLPNVVESTNFVVKWGSRGNLDTAGAEDLAAAFEVAWAAEITDMGYPQPTGTDQYKFNVYLGDSGDGAPASYGAAGYYNRDSQGQPYIVIAPDTIRYDYYATTAAHEFFHSVQDTTRSYSYDGVDAWFWEATAMWMEGEVYPDDPDWYSFLFGFALLPQASVWAFDYPDTGALEEYHQYGAAVWPRFLTEQVADPAVVYEAWVSESARTPTRALADALTARGEDVGEVFSAFAAHNVVFDYEDGRGMENLVSDYERYFGADAARVVDTVSGPTEGLLTPPHKTLPAAWGANAVAWRADAGTWRVQVEGDTTGDADSTADWGITVVTVDGDGPHYLPVPLTETTGVASGEVEVTVGTDLDEAWIVAAVLGADVSGEDAVDGEVWSWRYGVTEVLPPDPDTGTDDTGAPARPAKGEPVACGCASGARPSAWGAVGLGVLLLSRRRRHP